MKRVMNVILLGATVALTAFAGTLEEKGELGDFEVSSELENGIYRITKNTTIASATAGEPGLYISKKGSLSTAKTVVFLFENNAVLTVKGHNATSTAAATPGIYLYENSTLICTGTGSINAYGGNATVGTSGTAGSNATVNVSTQMISTGAGGSGGLGGNGAAPGIGTIGGIALSVVASGGASTSWPTNSFMGGSVPEKTVGNSGKQGATGGSTDGKAGTVWLYLNDSSGSNLSTTFSGGSAGAKGASVTSSSTNLLIPGPTVLTTNTTYVVAGGKPGEPGNGGLAAVGFGTGAGAGAGAGGSGGASGGCVCVHATNVDFNAYAIYGSAAAAGSDGTASAEKTVSKYIKGSTSVSSLSFGVSQVTFSRKALNSNIPLTLSSTPTTMKYVLGVKYDSISVSDFASMSSFKGWQDANGVYYFDKTGKASSACWNTWTNLTLYPDVESFGYHKTGVKVNNVDVDATDVAQGEEVKGNGWTYAPAHGILHIIEDGEYALTGTATLNDVMVSVETPEATLNVSDLNLAVSSNMLEDPTLAANRLYGVIAVSPGAALTINATKANSAVLDASAVSDMAGIYCPTGASVTITGPLSFYDWSSPDDFKASWGTWKTNAAASAESPCIKVVGGTKAAGIGGAGSIANGRIVLQNCIVWARSAGTDSAASDIGCRTDVIRNSWPIVFYRGTGIMKTYPSSDTFRVCPRSHDEYDLPNYYLSDFKTFVPAGEMTINGTKKTVRQSASWKFY